MSWANINLSEINPAFEIVPEGQYTFTLGGAKYSERDPGRIEANATIATEGDFTGRKMFFSYPDPEKPKCEWSPKALKRLEQAIGVDSVAGEDPVAYLNRVAGNKFSARVKHSKATEEYPNPRAELGIHSVSPAA